MMQPVETQHMATSSGDSALKAVWSVLIDYGVLGVMVMVTFYVIIKLWREERTTRKEAQGERDTLQKERVQMRIDCAKELSDVRLGYEKELAQMALAHQTALRELQEQHYEERLQWQEKYTTKLETVNREVMVTAKSLETTLTKALERAGK